MLFGAGFRGFVAFGSRAFLRQVCLLCHGLTQFLSFLSIPDHSRQDVL